MAHRGNKRWRDKVFQAKFTPFEIHGYTTCFTPTHYQHFAGLLFRSRGEMSPIQFCDLARFVEDFTLADVVLVPRSFYHIACEELEHYDPSCATYFHSIEDDLMPDMRKELHGIVSVIPDDPRILADRDFQKWKEGIDSGGDFRAVFQTLGKPAGPVLFELETYDKFRDLLYFYSGPAASEVLTATDLHTKVIHHLEIAQEAPPAGDILHMLAKRGVSVSPGVGFAKIFEASSYSLTRDLYDIVARHFRIKVERLYHALGVHTVYIPPLLTILLSRMPTAADFPKALVGLRKEFRELRQEIGKYEYEIRSARSLKEKIDLFDEMERAQEALAKRIAGRTQKTFIKRGWDIVKGISPLKMGANVLDAFLEYSEEGRALTRVRRYIDIYSLAIKSTDYERQLERLFRDRIKEWDKLPVLAGAFGKLIADALE